MWCVNSACRNRQQQPVAGVGVGCAADVAWCRPVRVLRGTAHVGSRDPRAQHPLNQPHPTAGSGGSTGPAGLFLHLGCGPCGCGGRGRCLPACARVAKQGHWRGPRRWVGSAAAASGCNKLSGWTCKRRVWAKPAYAYQGSCHGRQPGQATLWAVAGTKCNCSWILAASWSPCSLKAILRGIPTGGPTTYLVRTPPAAYY